MSVKWAYEGDDKSWVNYSDAISEKIEASYQKKQEKIRVDTTRFISFKDMLQKRYDGAGKGRNVKRIESSEKIFENKVFFLMGEQATSKDKLFGLISKKGGLVAWGFHPKVTHIVCLPKTVQGDGDFDLLVQEANEKEIPIVNEDFVKATKKPKESDFIIKTKGKKSKKAESDDEEDEKSKKSISKSGSIKRKHSKDEESDEDKKKLTKKKSKVDESDDSKASDDESGGNEAENAADTLLQGTLSGVYYAAKHQFDIIFANKNTGEGAVDGMMEWPALDGTMTQFKGDAGDGFIITEFEVLEGKGVKVPNEYNGKRRGNYIFGTVKDPAAKLSKFRIKLK